MACRALEIEEGGQRSVGQG